MRVHQKIVLIMRVIVAIAATGIGVVPRAEAQSGWPGRDRLQTEQCAPMQGDAASWLRRADSATGLSALGAKVLSFRVTDARALLEQSDRVYPPFIHASQELVLWFDGETGAERAVPAVIPGGPPPREQVRTEHATYLVRDTALVPVPQLRGVVSASRALNPLAVLRDWEQGPGVTVVSRCVFRDYPRVVLSRIGTTERLYLDIKTAIPIKLERQEAHYLWGQTRLEYVYATWAAAGPVILPHETSRFLDGVQDMHRTLGSFGADLASSTQRDNAPSLRVPRDSLVAAPLPAMSQRAAATTDTVRVGPQTFLLVNPTFTQAVTLARDTIFLFDATTSEARGQSDSAWIAKLFPGRHAIVVVVTDVAWPHVAGLRYWVARGATVVTHSVSKPFVEQLLARRFTLNPDALERTRAHVHPIVRGTATPTSVAGGAVLLAPIDGIGSEGALIAMLPGDGFLWASDYVQTVRAASQYAREVMSAVTREGFLPQTVAAEHLGLTQWKTVETINARP